MGKLRKQRCTQNMKTLLKQRLRGELVLLFLARPAGQSVLSSASRPARRVYDPCPAGRPDSVYVLAGRPASRPAAWMLLYWLRFWPAGRPAAWLAGWLAGWLCLLDVFVHILQYSTQLYSTNTVQYSTAILFSLQYSRVLLILHWCVFVVHWVSCVFSIVVYWCYWCVH